MSATPSTPKSQKVLIVDTGQVNLRHSINEVARKIEQEKRDNEAREHGYKDEADYLLKRTASREHPNYRRAYISEVGKRDVVAECGHDVNPATTPRRNCQHCWFAYFFNHPVNIAQAKVVFDNVELTDAEKKRTITASLGDKGFKFLREFISQLNDYEARREVAKAEVAQIMGTDQVVDLTENTEVAVG